MKRKRVFLGALSMAYSKLSIALVQLAMVPAFASNWGLPKYGQWLLIATVPVFLAASDLGFGTAAGHRLIGEVAIGKTDAARTTFQSAHAVVLALSIAIFGIVVAIAGLLPGRFFSVEGGLDPGEARQVLIVLSAYGMVAMNSSLFMAAVRAEGGFAASASLEATVQLAEGMVVIAVVLFGGTPLQAAFAYLLTRTIGVMAHVFLATKRAQWLRLGFRDAKRARTYEMLRPAVAAMIMPLAQAANLQGIALAVGAAAGAALVPIFTSLRTLSRVAIQFVTVIVLPVLPELTAEYTRGNLEWTRKVIGALATLNMIVGLVAGVGLVFGGSSLLTWWTKGAISAPQPMILLTAVGLAAAAVWQPMSYVLLSVNQHERFAYAYGTVAMITVLSSFALVRQLGITGSAVASLVLDVGICGYVFGQLRLVAGSFPIGFSAIGSLMPKRGGK